MTSSSKERGGNLRPLVSNEIFEFFLWQLQGQVYFLGISLQGQVYFLGISAFVLRIRLIEVKCNPR